MVQKYHMLGVPTEAHKGLVKYRCWTAKHLQKAAWTQVGETDSNTEVNFTNIYKQLLCQFPFTKT